MGSLQCFLNRTADLGNPAEFVIAADEIYSVSGTLHRVHISLTLGGSQINIMMSTGEGKLRESEAPITGEAIAMLNPTLNLS